MRELKRIERHLRAAYAVLHRALELPFAGEHAQIGAVDRDAVLAELAGAEEHAFIAFGWMHPEWDDLSDDEIDRELERAQRDGIPKKPPFSCVGCWAMQAHHHLVEAVFGLRPRVGPDPRPGIDAILRSFGEEHRLRHALHEAIRGVAQLDRALFILDPVIFHGRLATCDDPSERVRLAARIEQLELEVEDARAVATAMSAPRGRGRARRTGSPYGRARR